MTKTLLCLHGWGGSSESFDELRAALKGTDIKILTPDLPGFGNEPEPKKPFSVDDYAFWTEDWLKSQLPIANCQLPELLVLGHSHGGRIAIKLAAKKMLPIKHLYLCAAAGIKRPRHFRRTFGLIMAKSGKKFLALPGLKVLQPLARTVLYKLIRVHDYEQASELMQQTLIKATQEDLRPLLKQIDVPTDIFWGTHDGMTPYKDAKVMEQEIKGSKLHTYPGITHKVHRERAKQIADVIKSTIL